MGRTAAGVRGMKLKSSESHVVGMICFNPGDLESTVLVVSEKGNGKRSEIEDYRMTNRGGKGVKTIKVTPKTGDLIAIKQVREENDLMITGESGIVIRMKVADIRVMGRATQGVRVINLTEEDKIADVAVVRLAEKNEEDSLGEEE
jgi:DNA gyrase subunit A